MSDQVKYLLEESEMPTAWYNVQADFATPLPPVINPGTGQPIGPQDMAPLFPMDIIMQEASVGPYAAQFIDIPEEVFEIYRLWRPTPLMRARRSGEGARYSGAHLLQVRRRIAGWIAQAQHGGAAGLLQQTGGHQASGDGNRRGAVGQFGGVCGRLLWPGSQSVHGQYFVPAEAVSPHDDGSVWRDDRGVTVEGYSGRAQVPGARIPIIPVRWASRSAKRWKIPSRRRTPNTRSARCSITCCCIRRSSAKKR